MAQEQRNNFSQNDDEREEVKDEIFHKAEAVEEEIEVLKGELKGYKKALHQLDQPTGKKFHFRFWMIPVGFILLVITVFVVQFIQQVNQNIQLVKEGVTPEFLATLSSTSLTQTPGVSSSASGTANVTTSDDPSIGPAAAAITLVEFGDFQCPFCKEAFPIVKQVLAQYPETIRFMYRDFPVDSLHPIARKAAEAAECAHDQGKFFEYHDQLFANQENPDFYTIAKAVGLDESVFAACFGFGKHKAEVEEDYQAGLAAGVRGTPTWFFNGLKVEGSLPFTTFVKIIQELTK